MIVSSSVSVEVHGAGGDEQVAARGVVFGAISP